MSKELQRRLEQTIAVDGCEFSEDALVFRRVDAEVLAVAGGLLQKWEKKASWYWGDYMVAYCDFQLREEEAERRDDGKGAYDEIVRTEKMERYATQYAEAAGVEPQTLRLRKSIAAFFKPLTRVNGLDWEHHRIAKWGSGGDVAVAQELLAMAAAKGWKAAKLKAYIKAQRQPGEEDTEPEPQLILPMELVAARRYASTAIKRVADMDLTEVEAQLAELQPVLAYATALLHRATANGARLGLATNPHPGGKESLSTAA